MILVRSLTVFVLLIHLIVQSEGKETIYDRYFNGFCYWSEDVSYHVHYSSGCKVYFTCQRGKFLDFHRCPDSTLFNSETLRCESNGICKEKISVNPSYLAWWKNVVGKIDDVVEALNNSSRRNRNATTSTSTIEKTQKKLHSSATERPSTKPPQELLQIKYPSVGIKEASDKDKLALTDAGNISDLNGSIRLYNGTSTIEIPSSQSVSTSNTSSSKTKLHVIPMQFDTQTSLLTKNSSPSVTTQSLQDILQEEISKVVEQSNLPHISAITMSSNTTKPSFMNDILFPIYQEVVKNSTVMSAVSRMFSFLLFTADPLIYRVMDQQVDEKQGSEIKISLRELKDAVSYTKSMARPFLLDISRYALPVIFNKLSEKSEILVNLLTSDDSNMMDKLPSMFGNLMDLAFKYRLMDKVSTSDQFKLFSLSEIRNDFKIVFDIVSNIM